MLDLRLVSIAALTTLAALPVFTPVAAGDEASVVESTAHAIPKPPWSQGDQLGMANTLGQGTWARCGYHLSHPDAKVYEISHVRSPTMPSSPFGAPLEYQYRPTVGIPGTRHAFNGESMSGEPGAQATQMDAIGHFGYLDEAWDGSGDYPADQVRYYGGYTQGDVKPSPDSPLLKLGIENVPPIVTTAVLLDARQHLGGGKPLAPGRLITAADIEAMIKAQGLAWRGLQPGDVLYVYTGWEDHWQDPDVDKRYYYMGPGLSYDAVKHIGDKAVVLVALDNPFTDPANEGFLQGKAGPAEGTPAELPWVVHHHNLTQTGIHQIQNAHLAELAADRVWTSCTVILPLRSKGAAGSPVRPIAIGAPAG